MDDDTLLMCVAMGRVIVTCWEEEQGMADTHRIRADIGDIDVTETWARMRDAWRVTIGIPINDDTMRRQYRSRLVEKNNESDRTD